jgi:hypothetical protein
VGERQAIALGEPQRHLRLTAEDIALLNPNTHTCPLSRDGRTAEINKAIYRRVPVVVREAWTGRLLDFSLRPDAGSSLASKVMSSPEPTRVKTRSKTLRQAASAMFAFTTIVPLMILVWTLHRLDALSEPRSQVGLGLALAVALLGFYIFRQLMGRMSDLIQALGAVVDRRARPAVVAPTPIGAPEPRPAPAPPPRAAVPGGVPAAPAPASQAPSGQPKAPSAPPSSAPPASPPPADAPAVPGLGHVQEVRDLGRAIALLWQSEAASHMRRRVVISVMNASRPISGTLLGATDDGLLLEVEGSERITVSYQRIAAIDAEQASSSK